jgi:hypothetical protein
LSWGGYSIREADVIAAYDRVAIRTPKINKDGFSMPELSRAVAAMEIGVTLDQRYLTPEQLKVRVRYEPLIVFLPETSGKTGTVRGHFTIVDGYSPRRGFRRADSADGSYTFHPEQSFLEAALRPSTTYGRPLVPTFALRHNGAPVAFSEAVTPTDERQLLGTARNRLLESLAPVGAGTMQLTLTAGVQSVRLRDPGLPGIELRTRGQLGSMQLRRGIGPSSEIFVSSSITGDKLVVQLPGQAPIALAGTHNKVGPVLFGFSREIEAGLPAGGKLIATAVSIVDFHPRFGGLGGQLSSLWQIDGDWSLRGGAGIVAARQNKRFYYTASAEIGATRQLSPRLSLTGDLSFGFPVNYPSSVTASASLALQRSFGSRWAGQIFLERSFLGTDRLRAASIGLTVAYQFPRRIGSH